ncbi:MAG: heavy-metal-associated domain-containing protein [Sulfuriflexus sp.]|nr:heavy-metal-associated domain-containing protein [Sulfuriflexus sp.]
MADSITINVSKMKCAGCVSSVEQALLAVEGVESAVVSLEDNNAIVTGAVAADALIKATTDAGFPATSV